MTTVAGQWNFAKELRLDPSSGGFPDAYTFFSRDDTLYVVSVQSPDGGWLFGPLLFVSIIIPTGFFLIGVGILGMHSKRPLFPSALLAGMVVPLTVFAFNNLEYTTLQMTNAFTVIGSVLVFGLTYGILHWIHDLG